MAVLVIKLEFAACPIRIIIAIASKSLDYKTSSNHRVGLRSSVCQRSSCRFEVRVDLYRPISQELL